MMDSRFKRISSATALFLAFATSQVYLTVSFAGPGGNPSVSPQRSPAILTTSRNMPISVNGATAVSGATILTGATVETPDQVGATINIPGSFSLEIEPNAKLTIAFDSTAIKVTLIRGCVELRTKKGTSGEIINESGQSRGKSDPASDGDIDVCEPRRGGIGTPATVAIVGAGAAALAIILASGGGRGSNPSPSAPQN